MGASVAGDRGLALGMDPLNPKLDGAKRAYNLDLPRLAYMFLLDSRTQSDA